jgi:hypothetical protein
MKRTLIAIITPPVAVIHHGIADYTAVPIGVFWLSSLVSIIYGLTGETLAEFALGLGLLLWGIAASWACLVISGVDDDIHHHQDSSLDHRVKPDPDELDPLQEVRQKR